MHSLDAKIAQKCKAYVQEAGEKALQVFRDGNVLESEIKKDGSVITPWDEMLEVTIRKRIKNFFPDHAILGEEVSSQYKESEYTWYIDPIDGTSNFLLGIPLFGPMIAVAKNSVLKTSAVFLPAINKTYWVNEHGQSCVNNDVFNLKSSVAINKSVLLIESGRSEKAFNNYTNFLRKASLFRTVRRFGNMVSDISIMLSGHDAVHVVFDAQVYDLAPAACLYKNAGFAVVNFKGETWDIQDRDLIAVHPDNLDEVVASMLELSLQGKNKSFEPASHPHLSR